MAAGTGTDVIRPYNNNRRCVVIGGAGIADHERIRSYIRDDDFIVYCDSGLRHMEALRLGPSLIVGDFDSHEDPHMDVETIVLPVAKDDTDTVFAVREGMRRGFRDFLLIGVIGGRIDHTLANISILLMLDKSGAGGMAVDDFSELEIISASSDGREDLGCSDEHGRKECSPGHAEVDCTWPFFSLINIDGSAHGVTIRNAKFDLEDAEITCEYQYGVSNEPLPGRTAEIDIREGRLLLVRDIM